MEPDLKKRSTSSSCTFGTLRAKPDALVSVADLKAAKIVGSHQAARRWVEAGKLPEPIVLPNGYLRWLARDILKAIGIDTDDDDDKNPSLRVIERDGRSDG